MSLAIVEVDEESDSVARLPSDNRDRFGARRRARPASSRFDVWLPISWSQSEVDFVRCLSVERCMRAMLVVPCEGRSELPVKASLPLWHHNPTSGVVFHSSDEALDTLEVPGSSPANAHRRRPGRMQGLRIPARAGRCGTKGREDAQGRILRPDRRPHDAQQRTEVAAIPLTQEDTLASL